MSGTRVSGEVLNAICFFDAKGRKLSPSTALGSSVIALIHYATIRRWLSAWWQGVPYWAFACHRDGIRRRARLVPRNTSRSLLSVLEQWILSSGMTAPVFDAPPAREPRLE